MSGSHVEGGSSASNGEVAADSNAVASTSAVNDYQTPQANESAAHQMDGLIEAGSGPTDAHHHASVHVAQTSTTTTTTTYIAIDDSAQAGPSNSGGRESPLIPIITNHLPNGTALAIRPTATMGGRARPLADYPPSRKTGYVYDERMMLHAPLGWVNPEVPYGQQDRIGQAILDSEDYENFGKSNWHPEEPRRVSRIYQAMQEATLIEEMVQLPSIEINKRQSMLVHSEHVWDDAEDTATWTMEALRASFPAFEHDSLYFNSGTALAARLSCGGVVQACRAVVTGKVRNSFAIVRPPGHHAEPDKSMGFCIYNNVAVAAKTMMEEEGVKRILIVDWDVHHGNGTQRAFFDDPNVLYLSIHRHDGGSFYPCSDFGAMDVTGQGSGEGRSVNIPWPKKGFGDADYMYAFQKIVMPIAYEFAPELVIISAGFDAAEGDNLGECKVTPPCYAHMTYMLQGLAGGKLVVALEGGYSLEAIARSSTAVAGVLLGHELPELAPMVASDLASEVVYQVAKIQSRYWKSIDIKGCEPLDQHAEDGDPDSDRVYQLLDILKLHRTKFMYDMYDLYPVPIADQNLDKLFPNQVLTDGLIYDRETLVVFVHDFGNIQVESDSPRYTDASLEKSRLIDSSSSIVKWAKRKGYSLLDINVLKSLPTHRAELIDYATLKVNAPRPYAQLVKYVWDNYVELVETAKHVVLVGYGTGCSAIMSLVNSRDVQNKVSAVIQIAGMQHLVRPDPQQDEKREWFRSHSKLFLPGNHPLLDDSRIQKRLSTQIIPFQKVEAIDVLRHALPQIEGFVSNVISPSESQEDLDIFTQSVVGEGDGSRSAPLASSSSAWEEIQPMTGMEKLTDTSAPMDIME